MSKGNLPKAWRKAGPYLLVELFLPGGTLLALVLWLTVGTGRGQLAEMHHAAPAPVAIERVIDTCVCA